VVADTAAVVVAVAAVVTAAAAAIVDAGSRVTNSNGFATGRSRGFRPVLVFTRNAARRIAAKMFT